MLSPNSIAAGIAWQVLGRRDDLGAGSSSPEPPQEPYGRDVPKVHVEPPELPPDIWIHCCPSPAPCPFFFGKMRVPGFISFEKFAFGIRNGFRWRRFRWRRYSFSW